MQSHSSHAKQKNAFSVGIKEWSIALADTLLVESESSPKFHKLRLDALSIPHYAIKKERPHGTRHGKTEAQKQYHIAFNAWKRCEKVLTAKKNITKEFAIVSETKQIVIRNSKIGWTEQKCIDMEKLAQEDHSYRLSREEFKRYQGQWYLTLNKSGKNAPMRLRSDFRAAATIKNMSPPRIRRRTCRTHSWPTISEMAPFFLKWFLVELGHVQKLVELMSSIHFLICCSSFRLQLIAIYCNRRWV